MAGVEEQHVVDSDTWSAWLDGELGRGERARVEAHLARCEECRRTVQSWRYAQQQLASYAPRLEPGDAEAFWARLAPSLAPAPRPRPDPALYLAPAGLAVAWALLHGVGWLWGIAAPLGGWRVLAAAWRWLATSGLFVAMREMLASRWAVAVPPGWAGSLWMLAGSAGLWTMAAALAVLYAAWLALWLQQPVPAAEHSAHR